MAAEAKRQKTNGGEEDVGHYFDAVGLPAKIPFEGPASRNPLAFKYVGIRVSNDSRPLLPPTNPTRRNPTQFLPL